MRQATIIRTTAIKKAKSRESSESPSVLRPGIVPKSPAPECKAAETVDHHHGDHQVLTREVDADEGVD